MRMYSRLLEIMREQHITVDELHRRTRVCRDAITALRLNSSQLVSPVSIARICEALNITLSDLFVLMPEDIWAPIRLAREVTIHYGSRSFGEPRLATGGPQDSLLSQQFIAARDTRAANWVSEYLMKLGAGIAVHRREHMTGIGRGFDPSIADAVRQVFERGNHVVIGSPVANQFAEEVVCHAHGVQPYVPRMHEAFPYGFVWDSRRSITSSFGWQGHGRGRSENFGPSFGIFSTQQGRLVAFRTVVAEGEGDDCALILAHRIFQPQAVRTASAADERIVICILGHGGPGTEAAARVATDPKYAAGLYPPTRGTPHMRVVGAKYTRTATPDMVDNRVLTEAYLIDDNPSPPTPAAAAAPAPETRPRRRRKPVRTPVATRARARWRVDPLRSLTVLPGGRRSRS